ncbi:hypothetical protein CKA32_001431 [Geitlerinema sp. FC II]|nr:hypothetical protein CKA32_001431 [Geitlerinema sp. FC II]
MVNFKSIEFAYPGGTLIVSIPQRDFGEFQVFLQLSYPFVLLFQSLKGILVNFKFL